MQTLDVEALLIAVGRGASTDGLGLDEWGIRSDRGYILVDEEGRAAEGVYAIGDAVAGTPQFAHVAFAQGMAAAERIADGNPVDVDVERGVPRAVYSNPEVAAVGLTEDQAKEAGYDVVTAKYPFSGNAKAQILRETKGFAKIVAERDGPVLGIHLIGPRVTENVGEALVAVGWESLPADIASFVHAHPTLTEVMGEASLMAIGRPFHIHG
jgi:dihydrolipoamide dehydrogenase